MRRILTMVLTVNLLLVCMTIPVVATSASTCQTKVQGDADCNGTVDFIDYFYFVQESHDIPVPAGVSADFNQDGIADTADRGTVVEKLNGTVQSFIRFCDRIIASAVNFRI